MANAVPGTRMVDGIYKRLKTPNLLIRLLYIALLSFLAFGLFTAWNHFHKTKTIAPSTKASPSQIEGINKQQTSGYLSTKDYASYQADRQTLATEYLTNNDLTDAERVMNDVLTNVPAAKINSASYSVLYQIEKAKGSITLEKKYLTLLISALKAEGKNSTATAAQKVLDSLQ